MKDRYDQETIERSFNVGDKVLVLLPLPGHLLKAQFHGPYEVVRKASDLNYVARTLDRRKSTQMCHINMLKPYYEQGKTIPVLVICGPNTTPGPTEIRGVTERGDHPTKLYNSEVLAELSAKLSHLALEERKDLASLIEDFRGLFPDAHNQTTITYHDVEVDATPTKQHPYRVNPRKAEILREEVAYMLENGIIERSQSSWSSPCVLVDKPDGSVRFYTDYRKVNSVTKTDSYPIPRMDCIDKVGKATYIMKLDLLKGYWVCAPNRAR